MDPIIALALKIVPGLLKSIGRAPDNNVRDAVTSAVTQAVGAVTQAGRPPTAEQAQVQLAADPDLRAKLEASNDLQIALARIALDHEQAMRDADLAQQVQRDKAQAQAAGQDAQSQQGARAMQMTLAAQDSKVAWVAPTLSVFVTLGYFITIFIFIGAKRWLEISPIPADLPPPETMAGLTAEQIAALVRPPSDFVIQIINILIGALTAAFTTVISFWLGSSQGSRVKDQQIVQATDSAVETAKSAASAAEQGRSTAEAQRDKAIENTVALKVALPGIATPAPGAAEAEPEALPGGERSPEPPRPLAASDLAATLPELRKRHGHFPGGVEWALTPGGISVDGAPPVRTLGQPSTVAKIWTNYGRFCAGSARATGVPVELIVATIATESAGNPNARRPEPRIRDESVGLMQTLVTTAREAIGDPRLSGNQLLDPETSIKAGTAYIAQQRGSTRCDPPLVAAAYNAGSLRRDDAPANRWRLHCFPKGTGRHIDNFVAWFGDAMFVSARDDWGNGGSVPSFARLLRDDGGPAGPGGDAGPEGTGPSGGGPAAFPARPDFSAITSVDEKKRVFGEFRFRPAPLPDNPENIEILDDWERDNIVTVPLPVSRQVAADGTLEVRFNRRCAAQLQALFEEWRDAGLLDRILTYDGAFVPRFQRGSTSTLSAHSWGTAFDINAAANPLGREPAAAGQRGCVYDLVPAALRHGFFWGGHFSRRKDGMHFEVARVLG